MTKIQLKNLDYFESVSQETKYVQGGGYSKGGYYIGATAAADADASADASANYGIKYTPHGYVAYGSAAGAAAGAAAAAVAVGGVPYAGVQVGTGASADT